MAASTYHGIKVGLLIRAACCLELGALDFGSHHALTEELLPAKEEFMIVSTSIRTPRNAIEAVKIELPLKARELALTEVVRHDMFCELLWLVDHKASTMRLPSNNVSQAISLDLIKHAVKFLWKGHRDTTSTASSSSFRLLYFMII